MHAALTKKNGSNDDCTRITFITQGFPKEERKNSYFSHEKNAIEDTRMG